MKGLERYRTVCKCLGRWCCTPPYGGPPVLFRYKCCIFCWSTIISCQSARNRLTHMHCNYLAWRSDAPSKIRTQNLWLRCKEVWPPGQTRVHDRLIYLNNGDLVALNQFSFSFLYWSLLCDLLNSIFYCVPDEACKACKARLSERDCSYRVVFLQILLQSEIFSIILHHIHRHQKMQASGWLQLPWVPLDWCIRVVKNERQLFFHEHDKMTYLKLGKKQMFAGSSSAIQSKNMDQSTSISEDSNCKSISSNEQAPPQSKAPHGKKSVVLPNSDIEGLLECPVCRNSMFPPIQQVCVDSIFIQPGHVDFSRHSR